MGNLLNRVSKWDLHAGKMTLLFEHSMDFIYVPQRRIDINKELTLYVGRERPSPSPAHGKLRCRIETLAHVARGQNKFEIHATHQCSVAAQ